MQQEVHTLQDCGLWVWERQTWYDDTCVFGSSLHGLIGSVGHCVQMRRVFVQLPASVCFNGIFSVDVHLSVWVNRDDDFSDVGVDTTLLKPVHTKVNHKLKLLVFKGGIPHKCLNTVKKLFAYCITSLYIHMWKNVYFCPNKSLCLCLFILKRLLVLTWKKKI